MPTDHNAALFFCQDIRRTLSRLRYRAECEELQRHQTMSAKAKLNACVLGGSSKHLYYPQYGDGPPPILSCSLPNADPISRQCVTGTDNVKSHTVQYFTDLYSRSSRPSMPKPWLQMPSIVAIHYQTGMDPFQWPHPLNISDAHAILRKGNPRPAPGPDGWEKWMIKSLHDFTLEFVLSLWNYSIVNSHFPQCIKPMSLTTIHKHGDLTDLSNFRGICTSNLNVNMPFAWLNNLLMPYLSKHGIIPNSQIAMQPGVQGRDLTSFLAQLESWSDRTHMPLYILHCDQRKGFDRLEPEGFYDAVTAYGLPSTFVDFDVSAQTDVPYCVKMFYGDEPKLPWQRHTKNSKSNG
ncbi:hypothetical protein EDD18DRAFT_1352292 [Armillaria luteobubalina]|uniref:Reverse transcriptase domain-containing protein n=1 Tax=Armillaria luteobubalina TaxID=153913 RepID=A0AA39UPV4_9AGAR|nr:hypothetical protein EDD18DRAFT_1352292 [Armillaria luteobubalina]